MRDVFVLGSGTTKFQRWPDRTHEQLAREALALALADAGVKADALESAHVGCCALHLFGQPNIRAQALLFPLVREGALPASMPLINVEAGCATGAVALQGAHALIASGQAEVALALGVEKTFIPTAPAKMLELFEGGLDQLHADAWRARYAELAPSFGTTFAPRADRITILDAAALTAAWHMQTYGTTAEQLAAVASKNHAHGALNPNAQYQQAMSVEAVLADKAVLPPFTRAMCAPISDGAAAVVLCSEAFLARAPGPRPKVRVAAVALANGARWHPAEPSVTSVAAQRAYRQAGITAEHVDVAELHDATAFSEVAALEALGFCPAGEGGPYSASGATALGGARPINTSGGLESKGHPLAASGLAMVHELALQLRGEAGARQVKDAAWALAHNAGGLVGFDEATCAVTVLERR